MFATCQVCSLVLCKSHLLANKIQTEEQIPVG